ncbi:hypothetical protein J6590_047474 [Homalodisca vitripennis]|nr:hypothetical protein J6590_092720 [Homalodisca vitripennis]KAG8283296.1 hypothetical protein J6590_021196 [Homalodisca vitripennis]KAG8336280.1 hypothetical protein J6590_047474 [Homalodisca vitripennis]
MLKKTEFSFYLPSVSYRLDVLVDVAESSSWAESVLLGSAPIFLSAACDHPIQVAHEELVLDRGTDRRCGIMIVATSSGCAGNTAKVTEQDLRSHTLIMSTGFEIYTL